MLSTLVDEIWGVMEMSEQKKHHVVGSRSSFSKYLSKTFVNQAEQSKLTIEALDPDYELAKQSNKMSSKITENDLCPAFSEIPSELDSAMPTKREHFR